MNVRRSIAFGFAIVFYLGTFVNMASGQGVGAVTQIIEKDQTLWRVNSDNLVIRSVSLCVKTGALVEGGFIKSNALTDPKGFSSYVIELPIAGIDPAIYSSMRRWIEHRVHEPRAVQSCNGATACCEVSPDFSCRQLISEGPDYMKAASMRELIAIEVQSSAVAVGGDGKISNLNNDTAYAAFGLKDDSSQPPLLLPIIPDRLHALLGVSIESARTFLATGTEGDSFGVSVKCSNKRAALQHAPPTLRWRVWRLDQPLFYFATEIHVPDLVLAVNGNELWLDLRSTPTGTPMKWASVDDKDLFDASRSCFEGHPAAQQSNLGLILGDSASARVLYLLALAAGWASSVPGIK